jgi:hypothetical protein
VNVPKAWFAEGPPLVGRLFVMKEIGGLEAVLSQRGFEEVTSDLIETILGEAAKFAAQVLAPIDHSGDVQGCRWQDGTVTTAEGFRQAYASSARPVGTACLRASSSVDRACPSCCPRPC